MMRSIIALVLFVAAGVVFFVYTKPTYSSLESDKAIGSQYDQALEKSAELQALKQQLLSRYNSFNPADISRLETALPDGVDNIRLILDLDNMAQRHGMALQNVVVNSQSNTPDGSIGALSASGQKYASLTLQFSTQGTYDDFKQFLSDLEQSLRLVDLVTLTIHPSSTAAKNGDPTFSYDVTLRTYWLK